MNRHSKQPPCPSENLTLFLYGELDEAEHLQVERHLHDCEACRKELAQLRDIIEILPKEELKVSPVEIRSFNERLMRRVRPRQNRLFRPLLAWSLGAAATAAILFVTVIPPGPQQKQPYPAIPLQMVSEFYRMPETEMLLNLELLQNLDLLQELADTEALG